MTSTTLRHLPLAKSHGRLGARFAPFAGWAMPVQYTGIVDEHRAVRDRAGVFDVSHMGRLFVEGPDAARLLRRALTYKVDALEPGQAHYALLCADDGGILDDVFVYRLDTERFIVVDNAANVDVGRERIGSFVARDMDLRLDDRQTSTVMLALQGPEARDLFDRVVGAPAARELRRHRCVEVDHDGAALLVARTGYTGEDGYELVTTVEPAARLLDRFVAAGAAPCGLGARDTLRLEAALPLYGNDIDTTTNPWEAGLGFAVTLDDGADFAGRNALLTSRDAAPQRALACLRASGRGVMRHDYVVLHGDTAVARVTSGGFSPTLETSIGMAYLPVELAGEGTELQVDVRGRPLPVVVVPRPFYRRPKARAASS